VARRGRRVVPTGAQPVLEKRIPATLRSKDSGEGSAWFGFSTRARVVVYDKVRVPVTDVDQYEKLGAPVNKGRVCTRSGSHPYNLSLFGAMLEHLGPQKTETWLKGMVGQHGTAAQGRRHRPDQGRGQR
jgi:iron(III) transport system substrate-binding protein